MLELLLCGAIVGGLIYFNVLDDEKEAELAVLRRRVKTLEQDNFSLNKSLGSKLADSCEKLDRKSGVKSLPHGSTDPTAASCGDCQ